LFPFTIKKNTVFFELLNKLYLYILNTLTEFYLYFIVNKYNVIKKIAKGLGCHKE